jgi:hypothetical protein
MRDADIFYKAVLALVDREMKAKVMTPPEIAEALVLALGKVIETAPDAELDAYRLRKSSRRRKRGSPG